MSCLSQNCRGLGNPQTVRTLKKLMLQKDPTLVFLIETRRKAFEIKNMSNIGGFPNVVAVDCRGERKERGGGLACFWKSKWEVEVVSMSLHHVDMIIDDYRGGPKWRLIGIYGHQETENKHLTWSLIYNLSHQLQTPWACIGDFNQVLTSEEKLGGTAPNITIMNGFRDTVQTCGLLDMKFEGHKYTWTNKQRDENNIQTRLDRCMSTIEWKELYLTSKLFHLPKHRCDHCPLYLSLKTRKKRAHQKRRVLQFEEVWMTKEGFQDMVHGLWTSGKKLKSFTKCLKDLKLKANQEGDMEKYKKVENKLDELLENEEIMWAQRARVDQLKFEDRNTKFFHKKASQRKDRNWVSKIKDNQGFVYYDEEQIAQIVTDFFQELFHGEGRQQKMLTRQFQQWKAESPQK